MIKFANDVLSNWISEIFAFELLDPWIMLSIQIDRVRQNIGP